MSKKSPKCIWTDEEDKYLLENLKTINDFKKIRDNLGKDEKSVYARAYNLRVLIDQSHDYVLDIVQKYKMDLFLKIYESGRRISKANKESKLHIGMLHKIVVRYKEYYEKYWMLFDYIKSTFRCTKCVTIFDRSEKAYQYDDCNYMCKVCYTKYRQNYSCTLKGKLSTLRREAKIRRPDEFDLTLDFLVDMYNKQDGKCFYTGRIMELPDKENIRNINAISLDRIDSNKGYWKNNVTLCCWRANVSKNDMNDKEYVSFCKEVVKNAETKNVYRNFVYEG